MYTKSIYWFISRWNLHKYAQNIRVVDEYAIPLLT